MGIYNIIDTVEKDRMTKSLMTYVWFRPIGNWTGQAFNILAAFHCLASHKHNPTMRPRKVIP